MTYFLPQPYEEERPWGTFTEFTLNEPSTVKILTVKAGQACSLQFHHKRTEYWYVFSGDGTVTIGDKDIEVEQGKVYSVPVKTPHRISARNEDIVILEISLGEFNERDIERLEDRYGRIKNE